MICLKCEHQSILMRKMRTHTVNRSIMTHRHLSVPQTLEERIWGRFPSCILSSIHINTSWLHKVWNSQKGSIEHIDHGPLSIVCLLSVPTPVQTHCCWADMKVSIHAWRECMNTHCGWRDVHGNVLVHENMEYRFQQNCLELITPLWADIVLSTLEQAAFLHGITGPKVQRCNNLIHLHHDLQAILCSLFCEFRVFCMTNANHHMG